MTTAFQKISFTFFTVCALTLLFYVGYKEEKRLLHEKQVTDESEVYAKLMACVATPAATAKDVKIMFNYNDKVEFVIIRTDEEILARFTEFESVSSTQVETALRECRAAITKAQAVLAAHEASELARSRVVALVGVKKSLQLIDLNWEIYNLPPISLQKMRSRLPCAVAQVLANLKLDIRSYPEPIWQRVMAVEPWNRRIDDCLY